MEVGIQKPGNTLEVRESLSRTFFKLQLFEIWYFITKYNVIG